jgi:hypothetical protein
MYSADEADGEIEVFVAVLQGELSGPVVVRISTVDGTANSGSDYEGVNQTLTFDTATTRIPVTVPILEDNIDEEDENILARLSLEPESRDENVQIVPQNATLLIIDDDCEFHNSNILLNCYTLYHHFSCCD